MRPTQLVPKALRRFAPRGREVGRNPFSAAACMRQKTLFTKREPNCPFRLTAGARSAAFPKKRFCRFFHSLSGPRARSTFFLFA